MIYATFITGEEYGPRYAQQVIREVKGKDVHILTDKPELFPECKTELYDKEVFSYYDKLTFLVRKVLERKQRVTFIDCDWFSGLHEGFDMEPDTFYTYALFKFKDFEKKPFAMEGINMVIDVLEKNNFNLKRDVYIGEAIMSLPYLDCAQNILDDLYTLQVDWEAKFNQNVKTDNQSISRYARYGVGYGEGGALTAILQKYNVKLKDVLYKKFVHNNII
jgi:hypothetical protein